MRVCACVCVCVENKVPVCLLNNAAQIYTPRCSVMDFTGGIVYARHCVCFVPSSQ